MLKIGDKVEDTCSILFIVSTLLLTGKDFFILIKVYQSIFCSKNTSNAGSPLYFSI